jgi:hypothetical protein
VQTSANSGRTFSEPFAITATLGERKGYFHLVSDTQSSKFKDRLYFVRAAGYGGSFDGILLNYSNDKGRTWSPDRRVDLFDENGKGKAMVPSIAVNADGIVGISWVDSRNDPTRNKTDIYFTISMDGGESFLRPVRITEVSSNPRSEKNSDVANKFPGGGHYLGLTARLDDSFQLVWSDSRNGFFQLQTCNVVVARQGFTSTNFSGVSTMAEPNISPELFFETANSYQKSAAFKVFSSMLKKRMLSCSPNACPYARWKCWFFDALRK